MIKTNTSRQYQLKIPIGMYKLCQRQMVLTDIIFWLQLKTLNCQGFLNKKTLPKICKKEFGITQSSFYKKIKRLKELCYIKEEMNSYKMISYDSLWKSLNYDKVQCEEIEGKLIVRNSFKLMKINVSTTLKKFNWRKLTKARLQNIWIYNEIHSCYINQVSNICKHLYSYDFNKKKWARKVIQKTLGEAISSSYIDDSQFLRRFNKINRQLLLHESKPKFEQASFADITLSTNGLSNLLGYDSNSNGYCIQKKLEKMRFISIKKRKIFLTMRNMMFRYNLFMSKFNPDLHSGISNEKLMVLIANYFKDSNTQKKLIKLGTNRYMYFNPNKLNLLKITSKKEKTLSSYTLRQQSYIDVRKRRAKHKRKYFANKTNYNNRRRSNRRRKR